MYTTIRRVQSILLFFSFFFILFFFLPVTQDIFVTIKWYALGLVSLLLISLSLFRFILGKTLYWTKKETDGPLILIVITTALSTLFSSHNKVQALLHPLGLGTMIFLFILYFYFSRQKKIAKSVEYIFGGTTILMGVIILVTSVPQISTLLRLSPNVLRQIQFLSPIGTLFESLIFFSFACTIFIGLLIKAQKEEKTAIFESIVFIFSAGALFIVLFTIVKNMKQLVFPPLSLSWYAAVESLKKPVSALFGVGIDNFSILFTRVKDYSYNQSSLWQIPSFSFSRTAFLHILTETGLFGVVAYVLLFVRLMRQAFSVNRPVSYKLLTLFFICAFIIFPPSFILLFLLFSWVGVSQIHIHAGEEKQYELGEVLPIYAVLVIFGIMLVGGSAFVLIRTFTAEMQYKKALSTTNLKDVYEQMRLATITNPYIERFHINFAQVNMLIANNVASQVRQDAVKNNQKPEEQPQISEQNRQIISQAIQAAIQEAKNTVALNPEKAGNWELLAVIYKNIINIAQGADTWTVSAYQRAIVLDPQNPQYRLELGSLYYAAKNYDEALRMFEQAVAIKPDWANAQYNFAWASYQKANYQQAATAMQYTLSLLDPNKDKVDFTKATADLEEFKKKIPKTEDTVVQEGAQTEGINQQNKLSLPTPPVDNLEPKITLPKTASPEAK